MDAWNRTSTPWSAITKVPDFQERIAYDPNGNIQKYRRNGNNTFASQPIGMDSLNYFYTPGTNKLDHITDSVPSGNYTTDIDGQSSGNYKYDSIGELISDAASGITKITWTVYGKIDSITKSGDTTISFTYDPAGNRISKSVTHGTDVTTTWYVRDAQGNVLSVYTAGDPSVQGKDLTQTELHIYGSSRLGILKTNTDVETLAPLDTVSVPLLGTADSTTFIRGNKLFELTNHLGNVLATISDKRYGVSTNDSTVNYFIPELVSANDYYPFGSLQPGRSYIESAVGGYRYGFNGQEKDDEIKGQGNSYTAEFWEYDVRSGLRWNTDPKPTTGISPYATFNGNPIFNSDPLGDSTGDPAMPRHPIDLKNSPSSVSYAPYNVIGSIVNGGRAMLSKAGDYIDHPVEQLNDDAGAIGDFFVSQYNYYTKTPIAQIKADTKAFLSDPDNYFHAAEDAFTMVAGGKFSFDFLSPVPKIQIAESFSLKATEAATADGSFYSVAYETKLPGSFYPGKSYAVHFSVANKALYAAMASDETFASAMSELGMTFKKTKAGGIDWTRSPNNFVWHHNIEAGVLHLVSKVQHTTNSIFWNTLHPGGVGGMHLWGK